MGRIRAPEEYIQQVCVEFLFFVGASIQAQDEQGREVATERRSIGGDGFRKLWR